MSNKISTIVGSGLPLHGDDIDTDRIIPARFLKCVTFEGLGDHVFEDDRQQLEGQHPFDQAQYQAAKILVVNRNFGCGSSREHAPQAIARWGIQAIVGESFAEIFRGNCSAIGLPCVVAESAAIQGLQDSLASHSTLQITVDLEQQQIRWGDETTAMLASDSIAQLFRNGTWDACGQLVAQAINIKATAAQLPYLSWGMSL